MKELNEIREGLLAIFNNYDQNVNPANKPRKKAVLDLARSICQAFTPGATPEYHGENGRKRLKLFRDLTDDVTIQDAKTLVLKLFDLTKREHLTNRMMESTFLTNIVDFIASIFDLERNEIPCMKRIGGGGMNGTSYISIQLENNDEFLNRIDVFVNEFRIRQQEYDETKARLPTLLEGVEGVRNIVLSYI